MLLHANGLLIRLGHIEPATKLGTWRQSEVLPDFSQVLVKTTRKRTITITSQYLRFFVSTTKQRAGHCTGRDVLSPWRLRDSGHIRWVQECGPFPPRVALAPGSAAHCCNCRLYHIKCAIFTETTKVHALPLMTNVGTSEAGKLPDS